MVRGSSFGGFAFRPARASSDLGAAAWSTPCRAIPTLDSFSSASPSNRADSSLRLHTTLRGSSFMQQLIRRSLLCIMLAGAGSGAQIPDSPPGRLLRAWMDAVNSGDRTTVQQFLDKSHLDRQVDGLLARFRNTGGYDVRKVEETDSVHVVVLAQERKDPMPFARITVAVKSDAPDRIASMQVAPAQPPPDFAPPKLTPAQAEAARSGAPFRQFAAWLDAFNSADRERIQKYLEANYPTANLDGQLAFRQQTGGFDLRALEQATPTTVVGLVQERQSDRFARFSLTIDTATHTITRFPLNAIPRPAEFPVARLAESELAPALRAKLDQDAAADRFSGAALVARLADGSPKILFAGAYGLADREQRIANTVDTRFRLGSMNKMFTATSILQLVQAGRIKLSDPVGKYITDYPNREIATKVTIHDLLTHTGGTGDFFGPEYSAHRLELKTLDDYIKLFGTRGPLFEPGSKYEYSNYGMLLLGVVIERVTGRSYYDYVDEHIYKPAGMTRSGSDPEDQAVIDRSVGYTRLRGATDWAPNTETLPYRGTSAGGGDRK